MKRTFRGLHLKTCHITEHIESDNTNRVQNSHVGFTRWLASHVRVNCWLRTLRLHTLASARHTLASHMYFYNTNS